jgi:hypothetical protein
MAIGGELLTAVYRRKATVKIDAFIVAPDCPDWAVGRVIEFEGKKFVLSRIKPRLAWPRWWNKLGKLIGWQWLYHFWGIDDYLRRKRKGSANETEGKQP